MKPWSKDLINSILESRCLGVLFGGVAQGHDDDDHGDDGGDDDDDGGDGDCYWFLCVFVFEKHLEVYFHRHQSIIFLREFALCNIAVGVLGTCKPYAAQRGLMQPCGALWSAMEPYAALWSPMGPYTALRRPIQPSGGLWSPMELGGALRSSMNPLVAL